MILLEPAFRNGCENLIINIEECEGVVNYMDILCYSKEKELINKAKFPFILHNAIFSSSYWRACKLLRKVEDFYKTDFYLSKEHVPNFIKELRYIGQFLDESENQELYSLITIFGNHSIESIRFSGD